MNNIKTNVMRILDKNKISYKSYFYDESIDKGSEVAKYLNEDPLKVFKTLVTTSSSKTNYVFLIPVDKELDLKKCAKAVNEKSIEMVKQSDLFNLTNYVHGGCSPIGMKKFFKTTIDKSILSYESIIFSGGKRGSQIELKLMDLKKVIDFKLFDLIN